MYAVTPANATAENCNIIPLGTGSQGNIDDLINIINEWPVYETYGTNFADPNNFQVQSDKTSYTYDTTGGPLGSVTGWETPTPVSTWTPVILTPTSVPPSSGIHEKSWELYQ